MTRRVASFVSLTMCLGMAFLYRSDVGAQDLATITPSGNYQLVENWAELPPGEQWGAVSAVAIDAEGTVHAFRREGPIFTFDRTGEFLRSWGEGIAKWTHGLEVDDQGFIWATDGQGHQVKKFTSDGKLVLTLGKYDVAGDGPDTFNRPTDVVVARNGEFYVADGYGNSRVVKFSKDGSYIKSWGHKGSAPGQLDTPHTLALDSRGRVFVGDRGNKRVQIFDGDGKFLEEWTHLGIPYGIDISTDDLLFVADGVTNRVTVASARDGTVIDVIEGCDQVHWVSVDPRGNVYVASNRNASLKKFKKTGTYVPVAQLPGARRQALRSERQAVKPVSTTASAQREFLDQYCVTCHDSVEVTAGLALDTMDVEDIGGDAEVWEEVLFKVRAGRMPPPTMPPPDQAALDGFAAWLEAELDHAAAANPQPGRVAVHRLNRTEYANAIRDLLSLEIDSRSVLIDEAPGESGFDNTAGALSVTPVLVERYLSAARKISLLAVGDPTTPPTFGMYRVPKMLNQDERTSEGLPFASRGGVAIRHRFPVDGEYVVKIRLQRQVYNHILGLGRPHPLDVRLDGVRIRRFTVGGDAPGRPSPDSFAGQLSGSPEWEKYMHDADQGLEVRFPARAGTRVLSVSFAEFTLEPEGVIQPPQYLGGAAATGTEKNQIYYGNPAIYTASIGGPYRVEGPGDTPSRQKIFVCRPEDVTQERVCAEKILSTLARRAYRRPVTEQDVRTLLGFYEAGRGQGSFDAGIQLALTRILVSPEFLVRIERAPADLAPGTVYRLSDLELASRLSFFLWSSIPDDELLELGVGGKLQDPGVLEQQVRRMLADERSKTLIDNFASQWLNLPKLRGVAPDPDTFPDFDENLREAFQQETEMFLESQIRADRSVMDLVSANYTFVNERLARHYDIPKVYGNGFRRVTFDDNEGRGGLLGQGSILTVTSYPNRTSPVNRGKWLLENLLASPPPPPPPNVEGLKEGPPGQPAASMRERLQEHRKNPACMSCHVWLDPYGFSLENFDAVGRWRTTNEDGTPVDASATLPGGVHLDGVEGLRRFLLSRPEQFAGALTEKLLAYALGRNVEHSDLPAIRRITREAAADNYRWSSIIEGIAKSVPFQMSTVADTPVATNTPSVRPTAAADPWIRIRRPRK